MTYKQTTQVPNFLFDTYLAQLTESELKVLLVVVRQTFGWLDKRTGKRKLKDRISGSQFRDKTGLSKRIITKTVQSLAVKNLLQITDFKGCALQNPKDRRGKTYLYYAINAVHMPTSTKAQTVPEHVHKGDHNKTNYTKIKKTKLRQRDTGHIGKFLPEVKTLFTSNT
jgi:hypothetical protein